MVIATSADARDAWTIATDDTRMTLGVEHSQPMVTVLESTQAPHNWAGGGMCEPLMDTCWIGGKETPITWRFHKGRQDRRDGRVTLVFTSEAPKMELRSIWRARPGRGKIEHWIEIENLTSEAVAISHQDSLSLSGLDAGAGAEIHWVRREASDGISEGGAYTEPLKSGLDLTLKSDWRDGKAGPWMAVQVGEERGLYVGWEFSGIGILGAKAGDHPCGRWIYTLAFHGTSRPMFYAGETFVVPTAFVGCYAWDVDEGSYSLHRWVIEKLRPSVPKGMPDPILNTVSMDSGGRIRGRTASLRAPSSVTSWAANFHAGRDMVRANRRLAMGSKRFPNGIRRIEEYIHSHGMKMGLWLSWARMAAHPGLEGPQCLRSSRLVFFHRRRQMGALVAGGKPALPGVSGG